MTRERKKRDSRKAFDLPLGHVAIEHAVIEHAASEHARDNAGSIVLS